MQRWFPFLANIEDLYSFRYNTGSEDLPRETGWSLFDLQAEFVRMGVPNESWTMTSLNKDYDVRFFFVLKILSEILQIKQYSTAFLPTLRTKCKS